MLAADVLEDGVRAPLRIWLPSPRSMPLSRVCAEGDEPGALRNHGARRSAGLPAAVRAAAGEQSQQCSAFRRFVGGGGLGRQASDLGGGKAVEGHELRGVAIADGDRAGLVQQQRVHVARHLDGCLNECIRHRVCQTMG